MRWIQQLMQKLVVKNKQRSSQVRKSSLLFLPITPITSPLIFFSFTLFISIPAPTPLYLRTDVLEVFYLVTLNWFLSSSPNFDRYWCMLSKSVGFFSMICLKLDHSLSTTPSSLLVALWFYSMNLSNQRQSNSIFSFVRSSTLELQFIVFQNQYRAAIPNSAFVLAKGHKSQPLSAGSTQKTLT